MSEETIEKVRQCLIEALSITGDEIHIETRLVGDLGAESIDFIDIIFRIEKAFGIRIPEGDLFPRGLFQDQNLVQGGRLTASGVDRIRTDFSFIQIPTGVNELSLADLANHYTVGMLVRYVESRVGTATRV